MNINTLDNNALAAMTARAPRHITHAIAKASEKTGVDFAYLMQQASVESSFRADVKAKTSSATGLYQFIESTWLDMVKKHGAKHGIDAKTQSKDHLLELRRDPKISAAMAGEYAGENKRFLEKHVTGNKDIGSTELYMAHFMGPSGAAGFLNALQRNPLQTAADLFPKEARANQSIFYDRQSGSPKTLQAIYNHFDQKFSNEQSKPVSLAHLNNAPTEHKPIPNIPQSMSPFDMYSYTMPGKDYVPSEFMIASLYQDLILNPIDLVDLLQDI